MNSASVRILLCDDHQVFLDGLNLVLSNVPDFEVVGEALDGEQVVRQALTHKPDIVLMDIGLPGAIDGIDATKRIKTEAPHIKILMLSMNAEHSYILQAVKAGASGYMMKNSGKSELIGAIRQLLRGKDYFDSEVAAIMIKGASVQQETQTDNIVLTEREKEIAKLIAQEYSNAEIAEKLFISVRTVEGHRSNILHKLNIKSTIALAKYVLHKGWL